MDLLIGLLHNLAYENWANGQYWSYIKVMNFILAYVYDHARDFPNPVGAMDVQILTMFYFLSEEDARFDL